MIASDEPRSLLAENVRVGRRALLSTPHVAPLTAYVDRLRRQMGLGQSIPYFDPLDGGVNALFLFLLEAPGPKAVMSGFVSRNNPDKTAENLLGLLKEAGLRREDTILWNVVPWYVGDGRRIRAVRREDVERALHYLEELLRLLPNLRAIVLVGRKAQLVRKDIARLKRGLQVIETLHPSPLVLNRPTNRGLILDRLRKLNDVPSEKFAGGQM